MGPRATDGSEWPVAGGIIIRIGEDEYIIAGSGIVVEFDKPGNTPADTRNLGEDGFLNSGVGRKAGQAWSGRSRVGLGGQRSASESRRLADPGKVFQR